MYGDKGDAKFVDEYDCLKKIEVEWSKFAADFISNVIKTIFVFKAMPYRRKMKLNCAISITYHHKKDKGNNPSKQRGTVVF